MKEPKIHEDYTELANHGWKQLKKRLDSEVPVSARPKTALYLVAASLAFFIFGAGAALLVNNSFRSSVKPVKPLEPIVHEIKLVAPTPAITLNVIQNTQQTTKKVLKKNQSESTQFPVAKTIAKTSPSRPKKNIAGSLQSNRLKHYYDMLPGLKMKAKSSPAPEVKAFPAVVGSKNKNRQAKLGYDLSTLAFDNGVKVSGGISVFVPLAKKLNLESGVDYGLSRVTERPQKATPAGELFGLGRVAYTSPRLNVKYRIRQSIDLPLSLHYQPMPNWALTGGVDVGLLISQKLVFEQTPYAYLNDDLANYKRQLNENELNLLNRFNIGAHGGVSWLPSGKWNFGVYYGHDLTRYALPDRDAKALNTYLFKLRMAHYF